MQGLLAWAARRGAFGAGEDGDLKERLENLASRLEHACIHADAASKRAETELKRVRELTSSQSWDVQCS